MSLRTTLTIDDDNAVRLERLQKSRDASWKALVNDVLRKGLDHVEAPPKKREPFRTKAVDAGEFLFPSPKEALAFLDREHADKKLGRS